MTLQTILWFIPACFALNMAFGPNNLLALTNGAREGVAVTLIASLGRILAFALMIAVTALGLGALLMASEVLFSTVKWAGAAYLVWLGIKLLRSGAPTLAALGAVNRHTPVKVLARQEFLIAIGNPKAILIFTAFFPQFIDRDQYMTSFAVLGIIFLLLELAAIAIYAALGTRLRAIAGNASRFRTLNRISGGLMIGFGVMLALASRPSS
ncbi:LysE family translocator [Allorhizobium borbori]|uniref:Threonine/homoserine/homoserine lactone efflux protein n=1 Tax=Allorhizobium borbori TaxID=485907 RepID=A0A7W6P0P2_9HYPH|nr:LysE family translocator [Allorhizobium borbori]MBB4102036.1 threonine/homoserine/homoserine lactone efflux protein [Allorhizobium borbori]